MSVTATLTSTTLSTHAGAAMEPSIVRISASQQGALLTWINRKDAPWVGVPDTDRKVQQYGAVYNFKSKNAHYCGAVPIPVELSALVDQKQSGYDFCIVEEYSEDQGSPLLTAPLLSAFSGGSQQVTLPLPDTKMLTSSTGTRRVVVVFRQINQTRYRSNVVTTMKATVPSMFSDSEALEYGLAISPML